MDDDGTPSGHAYPEEAVAAILMVPSRRLRPPVDVRTQRIRLGKHEVIVLDVASQPEAIMVNGNGFPYRVGDQVIREPQEVINERKQHYRRVGYEQRVRTEATIDDLDMGLARSFLSRTVYRDRPAEQVLTEWALVHPRPGGLAVTNGALLLFAKSPLLRWHPKGGIRFFRVSGPVRKHGAERNVTRFPPIELPLARAIEEAHRFASSQVLRSEKLHNLFFREMPEYPEFAWQEAIVNAFAHRDYNDQTRDIEVWFFADRMEVISPGDLVPTITLDQLRQRRQAHASRNPLIARALTEAAIMRQEGEGIPRMFEEMEDSYLRPPVLEADGGTFRVTLYNEPVFEGASPGWAELVGRLALSTAQKRVLTAHPEGFTNEDYRKLSGCDRDVAYRDIQEMVTKGAVLPPEAPGRGAVYRLSPDLRRMRAWLEARVPALRERFKSVPSLTNSDYRSLFGLTRHAALRELRALADEGFLRLVGQRRGSQYLPGPALRPDARE